MKTCPTCGTQHAATVRICPRDATVLEDVASPAGATGSLLDGKYELGAQIGQGGMGTIYRGTHLMLGKTVAVKLIRPELFASAEIVRRFMREARAVSSLVHPNIAAVHDLGQAGDGTLYIAMEFVDGASLKDVIQATGPMASARVTDLLRQVAGALSLAHRHHIVHRDLKPHNIMVTTDANGRECAKLLDFGIAKTFDDGGTQLTSTGMAIGTPQYMSPEQAQGFPIDARSDLYSIGVILYEMLTGELPFTAASTPAVLMKVVHDVPVPPSRRRPGLAVSPVLEAVALRCLEKDPAARFQTADEFAAALDAAGRTPMPPPVIAPVLAPRVMPIVTRIVTPPEAVTSAAPAPVRTSASSQAARVVLPPPVIGTPDSSQMPSPPRARRSTATTVLIVAALVVGGVFVLSIVAAIAVPSLLRARISGNEISAIASLKAINSAEVLYATGCNAGGFATSLEDLAKPQPATGQAFIEAALGANGVTKAGYRVRVDRSAAPGVKNVGSAARTCNGSTGIPASAYFASAEPETPGATGFTYFATDARGVIYSSPSPIANPIVDSPSVSPIR